MRVRSAWVMAGLMTGSMALPVEAQTHLGQPASSHVLLEMIGVGPEGACDPGGSSFVAFGRTLPDGTSLPTDPPWFRVPAGQVLVVTDVDWAYGSGPDRAGTTQTLRLNIENLSSGVERPVFDSTITLDSAGQGGASESMTAGFTMSSATKLCPDTFPGPFDSGLSGAVQYLLVRGYLVRDR